MYEPEFRCQKNGVPILSHKEIEDDAKNFIKDFDVEILERPRELDIERFVEYYLRLSLDYNNLSNCGLILGRMVFNDTDKIPIYDAERGRTEYISAERGTKRTLTTDHDWLEHQAKYFSAAILMPRKAMRVVCGDEAIRRNLTAEAPGFEEIFLANHVAEVFNVSVESARIRIKQLEYDFKPVMHNNPPIFTIGYPEQVFSL